MPFPNEHAARQQPPGKYVRFRRQNDKFGPGIHAIWGIKSDGSTELQSIRFDAKRYTVAEARKWLRDHGFKATLEPASRQAAEASLDDLLSHGAPADGLPDTYMLLVYDGERTAVPASSIYFADDGSGQPRRRFRKAIIRTGTFVKKVGDRTLRYNVTRDVLEHWVATFRQMQDNGVKVPVPVGHTVDPEANRGWVLDMYTEGDTLYAVIELIGEDAIKLADRTDVSIFSPPEFTDGHGNTYRYPILHVALVTDPVVPGLDKFEPLAAARSGPAAGENDEEYAMKKVLERLNIKADEPEKAEALVLARLDEYDRKLAELEKAVKASQDKAKQDKAKPDKPARPDPVLVKLAAENREIKLGRLVEGGHITPAVAEQLRKLYIGEGDDLQPLVASLQSGDDHFDRLVDALAKNDPVELGERSGAQVVFSLPKAKPDKNPLLDEVERRRKQWEQQATG